VVIISKADSPSPSFGAVVILSLLALVLSLVVIPFLVIVLAFLAVVLSVLLVVLIVMMVFATGKYRLHGIGERYIVVNALCDTP
jgi:uncharacterized membrane protein